MIQSLILLISRMIGFVIAGLLLKNYKLNSTSTIYIILLIIIISIRYFLLGLSYFLVNKSFNIFCSRYYNLALIVIPIFYLYFKKSSNSSKKFEKKEFASYNPFFTSLKKINGKSPREQVEQLEK